MYGSVFKMRVKPGEREALEAEFDRWMKERGPKVAGYVASYRLDAGGGEVWNLAIFQDEKTYRDNANTPEQDAWYQRMRSHLEADPEWHDGEIRELRGG